MVSTVWWTDCKDESLKYFRFPREPLKLEKGFVSYENDRIMGIPNVECDDGKVSESHSSKTFNRDAFAFRQTSAMTLIRIATSILWATRASSQPTSQTTMLSQYKQFMTCQSFTRPHTNAWTSQSRTIKEFQRLATIGHCKFLIINTAQW